MSYSQVQRPHTSYSGYGLNGRQSSVASSSASSAYSNASIPSRSSASSVFDVARPNSSSSHPYAPTHKRGVSETPMAPSAISDTYALRPRSIESTPESTYKNVRQSLRPLPQPPSATPSPKMKNSPHLRGHSVDLAKAVFEEQACATPVKQSPTPARPTSMILTRPDSMRGVSLRSQGHPNSLPHSPLAAPDLQSLQKSSTKHLRTLSRFAETASADEFAITSPDQEVVGLHGRLRLQRNNTGGPGSPGTVQTTGNYGWGGRNWMDAKRQFLQAYEYLCHIGEAKQWIEDVISRPIPAIVQLEEALRDGVTLAEVVEALNPGRRIRIFRHQRLQYRHSDNIAIFFRYLDEVELPDIFRFELIDLYEKKNIPKVIYCIHALSFVLYRRGIVNFRIDNLVGQLEFEQHELEAMQKDLDKSGVNMPSFGNIGADFGLEPAPPPEPVETEEERIDRELAENEATILDLQAQIRGAVLRLQLGDTMQWLWDNEDKIIELQAIIRGDFSRQIFDYRLSMRRFAVNLQSACRGFLVRQRQVNTEAFWKEKEADVLMLQSLVRAKRVRDEVKAIKTELQQETASIKNLQAAVRGFMARRGFHGQRQETAKQSETVDQLQAAMRGLLVRHRIAQDLDALSQEEPSVIALQAIARAVLTRAHLAEQQEALEACTPAWISLQSAIRGNATRAKISETEKQLEAQSESIIQLQSLARAVALRSEVAEIIGELEAETASIEAVQSAIRGMLLRSELAADQDALEAEEDNIVSLQSAIRGFLYRRENDAFLAELEKHSEQITQLQSLARAMLLRDEVAIVLGELEAEEESVIAFQTAARACLVRAKFEEKKRFFKANMEKVVKIQSFVRAKLQGEAYKGLMTGKNPPVNTVKNFVHLLNDSDFDFNEEIEFERLRKTVVQQVRQNEMSEQYNDQLDTKIALLVKNKITLDEVIRHQRNFGGHTGNLLTNTTMNSSNQFDLRALNKNSKKKLESYQELFFNLQTQPQYLARLFRRVREQGLPEKECKRVEHLIMGLFGYAQKRREEYYLLKLIGRAIREEVEAAASIQDYLRGHFFWTRILSNYTRSPRDRKYLRDLLGPVIRENIMDDQTLDLESDPLQIYRSVINNEELSTGQASRRPRDIPREAAIRDQETRELFTDHLRDLREISDQVLTMYEEMLHRVPYGIRFICLQIFEALCDRFPQEPQDKILQIVGNWFYRFYLQPALTAPEQVGVIDRQLEPLQKRNLAEVGKVLSQIASGRLFAGEEHIFMQPLNGFIGQSIERLHIITSNLISVPDAESTFDIDEFNDLYSTTKPTLYIKLTDIFAIHNLVTGELAFLCPNRDDVLREIIAELGNSKHNETEMMGVTAAEIQLTLNPKLHDVEDPEAEIKALFMETKRCILYIIRIQSGANLVEILVKPVSREDEMKWQKLLREEFGAGSNTRGAYSDGSTLADVTVMSYSELKRTALENIMLLEQAGRISRTNYYQDVLNAIALDIRTKSKRRIQRQRELEGVRLTLANLHEKAAWLEDQRKDFDRYIEQAMLTLQKKGKKRFLLPFTKQYNHERELQRSGRVPKFGSFKYSAKTLADKGVLVSWQGYTERQYDKINLTISCDEVGVYFLEGSMGSIQIPGASAQIPMDDLLQAQFNNHQFMNLFEGKLRLNVNLFLHLLYKKFYRTE